MLIALTLVSIMFLSPNTCHCLFCAIIQPDYLTRVFD